MSFQPPFMPPMMPPLVPGAGLPPLNQPPPNFRPIGATTIGSQPQMYPKPAPMPSEPEGPLITVFVGNISEKVPDTMIKRILDTCGNVVNWKRVSTFGFCEYDGPIAGARAVRLLNDLEIDCKKLVAKVDAKNKALLDDYMEETKKDATQATLDANAATEKKDDTSAVDVIQEIIEEYADQIKKAANPNEPHHKTHKPLATANIEEEKRDLISQEIGKFRKYTEEMEAKKEERKRREEARMEKKEREREKQAAAAAEEESPVKREKDKKSKRRSHSRSRTSESPPARREKERRRRRSHSRSREREMERERERREREMERERREREAERERREREADAPPKVIKNLKELQREKEIEEEMRERKKQEKKTRDKEAAYQERLRNWENRERRKTKEYDRERETSRCKEEEREKEAKRLKEFLEDYDDERDDPKYYKGRELQRRLADRVREADADGKDRIREQEELEELKAKIFSGEYDDPTLEFEKQKQEREALYKPKILVDANPETQHERELQREKERIADKLRAKERKERYLNQQISRNLEGMDAEPIESDDSNAVTPPPTTNNHTPKPDLDGRISSHRGSESRDSQSVHQGGDEDSRISMQSGGTPGDSPRNTPNAALPTFQVSLSLNTNAKKKKLVSDVFQNDDDQEEMNGPKKRKLVPLDYDENAASKQVLANTHAAAKQATTQQTSSTKSSSNNRKDEANSKKSDEEKRRHIKSIIDKIPTEKHALFNYPLDKTEIDSTIEKKIRPWINKKIIEYIGEPEPTLVDFICSKVLAGSTPQGILDDVQMVLDEEAEVFVVKMWRLLIYEVEAKKLGISK